MPSSKVTAGETDQVYWGTKIKSAVRLVAQEGFSGDGHICFHRTRLAECLLSPLLVSVTAFFRLKISIP